MYFYGNIVSKLAIVYSMHLMCLRIALELFSVYIAYAIPHTKFIVTALLISNTVLNDVVKSSR